MTLTSGTIYIEHVSDLGLYAALVCWVLFLALLVIVLLAWRGPVAAPESEPLSAGSLMDLDSPPFAPPELIELAARGFVRLNRSPALREEARRVIERQREPEDIEAWAARLAADVSAATD